MNRHKFDLSNVTGWRQVQPPASQEQAAQAGQEGFEQRSGEARQAAAQIPAPGVPALPDPFHPHPSQGDLNLIEGAAPWEAQPMMQGIGQEHAAAPYAGGSGSMLGASVLQPGHSTARHHHAPDSSVVDLNPPARVELRDHARSLPAAVQPDPPVVVSGRDKRPLYSNDATVVEGLRSALYAGKVGERTVTDHVNSLLGFGRWLFDNNKPGFAARLDDPLLDQDLKEYQRESGSSNVARALGRLKESARGAPMVGRAALNPDPVDAELIRDYKAALVKKYEAAPATGPNPKTIQDYAATLRRFSHYLHENNRPGIAARLYEGSLDEDARRYLDSSGNRWISALAHLRKFPPYAALGREIALAARPEDAVDMEARAIGDAAAQHSGPQEEYSWPEYLPPGKANEDDAVLAS
ncbi:hypothetical protein NKI86_25500, partial [Mesorhizobium sp. M0320]